MLQKRVIKAKVMAIRKDLYSKYVFQNIDEAENSLYRYLTVTRCPNWKEPEDLRVGDEGFLEYEDVKKGDIYKDKITGEDKQIQYDNLYFMNFVKQIKDNVKEYSF